MSVPILLGAGILILILRMVQDFPHVWMNLFLAFLWIGIFCWRNIFGEIPRKFCRYLRRFLWL